MIRALYNAPPFLQETTTVKHTTHKLAAVAALTCLITVASASSAFAQSTPDKLLKYAPKNSGFIVGLNFKAAKKTVVGKELIKEALKDKQLASGLQKIKKFAKFDVEKDLHSVMMASPSPTGNGRSIGKTFVLVLTGKFNKKHLDGLMEKEKSKKTVGSYTVISPEKNVGVALIDSNTMVITQGADAYRAAAWQTAMGKAANATKHKSMGSMIRATNTKKHIFILANARKLQQPKGPQVSTGIIEIGLKSGLDIRMRMRMKDEASATKAMEDLKKSIPSGKAMMAMVKAEALMDNLKLKQKGKMVTMTTKMSNKNVKTAIQAMREQQAKKKGK